MSALSTKVEQEIVDRAEDMKRLIEEHKQILLTELSETRQTVVKQVKLAQEAVAQQMSMLESLMKYTEEIIVKGSACDVAREVGRLHRRTTELLKHDVLGEVSVDIQSITFAPSGSSIDCNGNVVGSITQQSRQLLHKGTGQ